MLIGVLKMCHFHSSFAFRRRKRSATRRRRDQSLSRRFCGEWRLTCLCTRAPEPEVCLHGNRIQANGLHSSPSWQSIVLIQGSDTVTAVKSSNQTAVITALLAIRKWQRCRWYLLFYLIKSFPYMRKFQNDLFLVDGRCVLKMDHHCPWWVRFVFTDKFIQSTIIYQSRSKINPQCKSEK